MNRYDRMMRTRQLSDVERDRMRRGRRNASADLCGFEKELQVMGKGQALLTASYTDVPLPVQAMLDDGQ